MGFEGVFYGQNKGVLWKVHKNSGDSGGGEVGIGEWKGSKKIEKMWKMKNVL